MEERQRSAERARVRCMDALAFLERYAPASVDLLLTDPPYASHVRDIAYFVREWVPRALRTMKPTGRVYIFASSDVDEQVAYLEVLRIACREHDFRMGRRLGWLYPNTIGPKPKYDYNINLQDVFYLYGPKASPLDCPVLREQLTVQQVNAPDARVGIRHHRWERPRELVKLYVRHATRAGDLVIDPFAGSGTHLLVAAELGRRAEGAERNPETVQKAVDRGCVRES